MPSYPPMLDTVREIETPEGIVLELRAAGPVPRGLAWLLDTLIRVAAYLVLAVGLGQLGNFGLGLFLISLFLLEWFYPVVCEVYFDGVTPGKRALGLRVVNDDGTPVDWTRSMLRNLLRVADFLPLLYTAGLLSMFLSKDFKRLGDLAAGTCVIYREDPVDPVVEQGEILAQAPPMTLTVAEQRVLLAYAERRADWTDERARELAQMSGPLVAGARDPVRRILSIARWAAGAR